MSTSASHERLGPKAGSAAAAFALAVAMLGTTLPTPLYGLYRQRFGFSELIVTVIFAVYAAGVIASLVLFGRLSDQVGRRRMLLPGLVLSALSAVCFLTAGSVALRLETQGHELVVTVEDDGRGVDRVGRRRHSGLLWTRQR